MKNNKNSSYSKSIIQLLTGSLLAQLITVIVSPLTTRLYTAEEIGIYTILLTIITMFGPVINGKYDLAIVHSNNEAEKQELIYISLIFSMVLIVLISIALSFYIPQNKQIYDELGFSAFLIIVILLLTSLINIFTAYNNSQKDYKTISNVYVLRTFVQNLSLVLLGMLKLGSLGMLLSQLIGSLMGLRKQSRPFMKIGFKRVKISTLLPSVKKYKDQPLYSMPAHFVNSTSYSILNFFISGLFGAAALGYYSMSYRILGLPLSLISLNVSKVFYREASEEVNKGGDFRKLLIKTTLGLSLVSVPMVFVLLFFSPIIFKIIFGTGWGQAGVFVQILSPMFGIRLVVAALTPALIIVKKQKIELLIQCIFILCSVMSYAITKVLNLSINEFLMLISVTYSIIYLAYYVYIFIISGKKIT